MQLQLLGGSFDYARLGQTTDAMIKAAKPLPEIERIQTTFAPSAPHVALTVDRLQAESMRVSVGDVFDVLTSYVGSTYINQFNKYGLSLQVYAQADSKVPAAAERPSQPVCTQQQREYGPARDARRSRSHNRARADLALQPLSIGDPDRLPGQKFQFRTGDEPDGKYRQQGAAEGRRVRMDRDVVSGKDHRQSFVLRVRAVGGAGLSGPRRTVRKLDTAVRGAFRRSAGAARTGDDADRARRSPTISMCKSA